MAFLLSTVPMTAINPIPNTVMVSMTAIRRILMLFMPDLPSRFAIDL
jgi:hypothetical protein